MPKSQRPLMNRLKRKLWFSKYGWTRAGKDARRMLKDLNRQYSDAEIKLNEKKATLRALQGYKESMAENRFLVGKGATITPEEIERYSRETTEEEKKIRDNMRQIASRFEATADLIERRHGISLKPKRR